MILGVHLFDGGRVRHLERVVHRGGAWRLRTLPARFAAIEHDDEGIVLFDTGYHPALRTTLRGPAAAYHRLVPWRCDRGAARVLRDAGLEPARVRHVVISHLHADHVAGLVDFPRARLHLTRTAWDHVQHTPRWRLVRQGFFPELLPPDLPGRASWLPELPHADTLDTSAADLFGDGTLGVLALPGHAPGQVGLLVRPPQGPRTLLVADATFSLDALRDGALPSRVFRRLVFDDDDATRATVDRLRRWWADEPDLRVVPAHAWEPLDRPFGG